jgi:hypothetical protein
MKTLLFEIGFARTLPARLEFGLLIGNEIAGQFSTDLFFLPQIFLPIRERWLA